MISVRRYDNPKADRYPVCLNFLGDEFSLTEAETVELWRALRDFLYPTEKPQ